MNAQIELRIKRNGSIWTADVYFEDRPVLDQFGNVWVISKEEAYRLAYGARDHWVVHMSIAFSGVGLKDITPAPQQR